MAKKKAQKKQPVRPRGYSFDGWAVFNWGISYNEVYRTRKQAQESCWKGSRFIGKDGKLHEATSWNDVKDHMKVLKVKCVVQ